MCAREINYPDCTCIHMPLEHVQEVADVLFADRNKRVYVHALKEVLLWFKRYGIDLYAEMFLDVSLAAYLLYPPEPDRGEDWRKFLLSSLVREYLKEPYPFVYQGVAAKDYPEALYQLLVQDALYVWRLGPILVGEILKDETLLQPYWELEILLTAVLAEMELRGVELDEKRIARRRPEESAGLWKYFTRNLWSFTAISLILGRQMTCAAFSTVRAGYG